ncbi:MAG: TonB-dependent receptor [Acidobacteria bacterium]|nr:TonB-dependent receptor [Acidobacteriota bacterium]MBI3428364.1 TonB-dependent receptor [Acidobacteriota bacterium]
MLVKKTSRWLLTLTAALLLITVALKTPVAAQENRATIVGTVADQNGGALPNATVKALNSETNTTTTTTSNEAGIYSLPFLPIGKYQITVTAKGMKTAVHDSIELRVGSRLQLDFHMEVGSVSETVTVSAETPLLDTATASRGQVIDEQKVHDLPLLGRNPFLLAALASGVQITSSQGSISFRPFDNGGMDAISINGGRQRSNEFLIDGAPNTGTENGGIGALSFVPSPDAVQEFKVQSNTYDAQFGRTGGGTINVSLKGGTNKFHGALYHFFRNDVLNANSFQNNAAGAPRTAFRWNQPGLVVDGPIRIPKVYNGQDKAFFMFSWEKIKSSLPSPVVRSVPTLEQRNGDFSKTLQGNGQPVTIYDPLTTACVGNTCTRTAFANNAIPINRIDPVAKKLLEYIPLPNQAGNTQGFLNFFNSPNARTDEYDQFASRLDYNLSDKHKLSGRWLRNNRHETRGLAGYRKEASPFFLHSRKNFGGGIDLTSSLTPTLVSNFKINFIRHEFTIDQYGDNFDITQLGFPAALKSQLGRQFFPGITLSGGYDSLGGLGFGNGSTYTFSDASSFSEALNKTAGNHSLKFGGEMRVLRDNYIQPTSSFGTFNFTPGFTQRNALAADSASGNSFASLLLGYAASASVPINATYAFQHLYYGAYFQDDWRISKKLTLNLGVRWDYESPTSERYNQLNAGFDKTSASPLQAPGLSLKGGLLFVNTDNRLPYQRDRNNFGPRVGVAYQLDQKTVLRGGYGLSYLPAFDPGTRLGFSVSTDYVASTDGNLKPANTLSNPYPNGLIRPSGSALGLRTLIGQSFTFYDQAPVIPLNHQFSFGVQRELPWRMSLDVSYIGSRTRSLITSQSINEVSAADLAKGAAVLNLQVPNPMAGLIPSNAALNGPTIVQSQLLRPFPQFGSLTQDRMTIGRAWYNSAQLRLEKRLTNGLHYLFSYTFSKNMEAVGYLNAQDPIGQLASVITADHAPHRATISGGYDLPLFKNSSAMVRGIAGGWKFNLIGTFQSGLPVGTPGGVFLIGDPKLADGKQTWARWFNTCTLTAAGARQNCADASETPVFQIQPAFTLRSHSTRFSNIRTDRPPTFDISLFKTFSFKEKASLQFRAEAFNFANTPWFGGPNTTATGGTFGVVTLTQANDQRNVQLGLKLIF